MKAEAAMDNDTTIVAEQSPVLTAANRSPAQGWGAVFLAALPFLLILLLIGLSNLLFDSGLLANEPAGMEALNGMAAVTAIVTGVIVFFLAWKRKWPLWSATWYMFFVLPLLLLAGWLLGLLFDLQSTQEVVSYLLLPFTIAVLLYTVTRLDRLRGLLAALPVIYFLWLPNIESVPGLLEVAIFTLSMLLVCGVIAYIMRRGDWRQGLYALLAVNLAVGCLFAYVGIYHGGSLPFAAAGPNLVEVLRSLLPQYLAMAAILLGPLFAVKLRQLGHSGGKKSRVGYHLALGSLLWLILANLFNLAKELSNGFALFSAVSDSLVNAGMIVGMLVYLAGIALLYWDEESENVEPGWVQSILLALLPLAIPLLLALPFITNLRPVSNLYGIPLLWVLPHAASLALGLLWLGLSLWVVTQEPRATETEGTERVTQFTG
jgi:hypothetical protein